MVGACCCSEAGGVVGWWGAVRELDVPGEISEQKIYPFEFANVEMQYESYNGVNVRLR